MSAGAFDIVTYDANDATPYNISIQPETTSFTLDGVANAVGTGTPAERAPSVIVSGSRRRNGVIARVVRFAFTEGNEPPGYKTNGILQLPVMQPSVWASYRKQQTGTYTLEGTPYPVRFVGKSDEVVN